MIAALDQNVGDRFAQLEALGDGEKMRLALGGCALDEIGIAELLRMDQHRLSHLDFVVIGERADEFGGRAVDVREPVRQLRARFHFDIDRKFMQHVIEQGDLIARIAARPGGEEISDAL